MGIHAEVSFTHYFYQRVLRYVDWEAAEKEMVEDLGEMSYLNYNTELLSRSSKSVLSMMRMVTSGIRNESWK